MNGSMTSNSRRVIVVLHESEPGGATRAVLRAVPLLQARGWEFAFWSPQPSPVQDELDALGYVHAGAPRLLRYTWRSLHEPPGAIARISSVPSYLRRFRRWLRLQSPAIVHANTLIAIPEALAAARCGARILQVHEVLAGGPRAAAAGYLARIAADRVVTVSSVSADALARRGIRARVVHNGVQLAPPRRVVARDTVVVGTVGTVSRAKGSDLFVAAARRIQQQTDGLEFHLLGRCPTGRDEPWAREVIESATSSGVRYGVSEDVPAQLASWDIFVLPSRTDAFPLALLEAMSAGLPVVAARVGGIPEQVTPETGVIVGPNDVGELVSAILDLARRPSLRAAMGAAGRRRVESEFTLERQAEGLHRAYLDALAVTSAAQPRRSRHPGRP